MLLMLGLDLICLEALGLHNCFVEFMGFGIPGRSPILASLSLSNRSIDITILQGNVCLGFKFRVMRQVVPNKSPKIRCIPIVVTILDRPDRSRSNFSCSSFVGSPFLSSRMTSRPSVQASYKKLKGTLSVKPTQLEWIPTPGQSSAAPVFISIGLIRSNPVPSSSNLLDLQATPAHNPKVMIKLFVSQNPSQEPVASVFSFTSADARQDCNTIKEAIQVAIAERNRPKTVADVLKEGEEGLLRNTDLQMSLLKQDVDLSRMFMALVIEGKQLTEEQFWRARVVHCFQLGCLMCSICYGPMLLNGLNRGVRIMYFRCSSRKLRMGRRKLVCLLTEYGIFSSNIRLLREFMMRTFQRSATINV
jgi:hypothetical protein